MKFGKHLVEVIELSDPEWGAYWINYKYLKRKINEIVSTNKMLTNVPNNQNNSDIEKSPAEVEFFKTLMSELRKTADFFSNAEQSYKIRHKRITDSFTILNNTSNHFSDNNFKDTWTRLMQSCVKFYKDVLLLENFAIMNYCGFSKILKKHDKLTG